MTELYPLKFTPIMKDKIWGGDRIRKVLNKEFSPLPNCGESWEISGVQGEISEVRNGFLAGNSLQELTEVYMADLVGNHIYKTYGIEFPLLIKFIDANDDLSIQVHPDDKLAKKRHKAYGKTEMWYVIDADEGAQLITGFNRTVTKDEYLKHLQNKTLSEVLNFEKVSAGDVFFMPSGRVHAIGKGILLAEIQQTSDVTYRIYDWDRKDAEGKGRELHTELALDAIDFEAHDNYRTEYKHQLNRSENLVESDYFVTNLLEFDQPKHREYNKIDSFVIYMCMDGKFTIADDEGNETLMEKGETVLMPAVMEDVELRPEVKSKILEVYVK